MYRVFKHEVDIFDPPPDRYLWTKILDFFCDLPKDPISKSSINTGSSGVHKNNVKHFGPKTFDLEEGQEGPLDV